MAIDYLQGARLQFVGLHYETSLYELHGPQFTNRYYILSGAGTRQLMAFPEVVGFDSYQAMLPATVAALRLLFPGAGGDVDILTILRGGLNYPVEEACARNGIRVRDIHFVSCERIIENHIITGLDIKYEKIRVSKDRVLVIGDIIATGDTLRLCLSQVVDRFRRRGGSIRKIIFFTIGGTRAITLMEKMAEDIRAVFPEFEGFECFFYEGVFTVYENSGASGINVPDIDLAPRASTCRTSTSAGRAAAFRRNSAASCWATPIPCWRNASSTTAAHAGMRFRSISMRRWSTGKASGAGPRRSTRWPS